jgi:hypothetical protein
MENWLATSPWYGMVLWVILYISDYYLTIYASRGFREVGHFQFEGSFELTPQYQKDIDAHKPISRLHLSLLVLYSLLLLFIWWFTQSFDFISWAYLVYLGMFLLVEVAVHFRHLRNIFMIYLIRKEGGVEGEIKYKKQFTYKISAFDLYSMGVLFLIVALLTYSAFFFGGAIMCIGTGFKHSRLAKKAKSQSSAAVTTQS